MENPATVVNQIMAPFSYVTRSLEVCPWLSKLISELMSLQLLMVARWPLKLQPLHQVQGRKEGNWGRVKALLVRIFVRLSQDSGGLSSLPPQMMYNYVVLSRTGSNACPGCNTTVLGLVGHDPLPWLTCCLFG